MSCNPNPITDRFYNICTSRKRDKEFACLRFSEGRNIEIHNFNSPLPSENLLNTGTCIYIQLYFKMLTMQQLKRDWKFFKYIKRKPKKKIIFFYFQNYHTFWWIIIINALEIIKAWLILFVLNTPYKILAHMASISIYHEFMLNLILYNNRRYFK